MCETWEKIVFFLFSSFNICINYYVLLDQSRTINVTDMLFLSENPFNFIFCKKMLAFHVDC